MSAFILKLISCISMFLDHSSYLIFNKFSFFNYLGRFAFSIFAFQISEGYTNTKNIKKYFYRLLIFALISQIPYMLFMNTLGQSIFVLNVIFTLILGLFGIFCYDKFVNKFLAIIICILLGILSQLTHCDYGFYGVAIILIFYIFRNNKLYMFSAFSVATIIKYAILFTKGNCDYRYITLCLFTIASFIFIYFYNGKKGKDIKYLLYLFYPLHLLALYAYVYAF